MRRFVFGPEEQFVRPLGGYNAWFSTPDSVGLDGWFLLYQAGLNASMRPSHDPTISKARLAFRSEPCHIRPPSTNSDNGLVDRFAGAGWHCDELLTAATAADDYFDSFAQVQMDSGLRVVSRSAVTPDTAHPR